MENEYKMIAENLAEKLESVILTLYRGDNICINKEKIKEHLYNNISIKEELIKEAREEINGKENQI